MAIDNSIMNNNEINKITSLVMTTESISLPLIDNLQESNKELSVKVKETCISTELSSITEPTTEISPTLMSIDDTNSSPAIITNKQTQLNLQYTPSLENNTLSTELESNKDNKKYKNKQESTVYTTKIKETFDISKYLISKEAEEESDEETKKQNKNYEDDQDNIFDKQELFSDEDSDGAASEREEAMIDNSESISELEGDSEENEEAIDEYEFSEEEINEEDNITDAKHLHTRLQQQIDEEKNSRNIKNSKRRMEK